MRFWFALIAVVILDQWSKWMAATNLVPLQSVEVIPGVMWLTYVFNRGAAFSMMQGQTVFLVAAGFLVVFALIAYVLLTKPRPTMQLLIGIMTGGALGNLLDRCFLGHVVDFIDFRIWPVFNVADIAISCGGIVLLIYYIWFEREE